MQTTVIRRATPDDAAAIAAIYAYYVKNTAVTFENEPPGAEEIRERIETYSRRYPYLCITQGDTIIGFAFAHHFRERPAYDYAAETSIYICPTTIINGRCGNDDLFGARKRAEKDGRQNPLRLYRDPRRRGRAAQRRKSAVPRKARLPNLAAHFATADESSADGTLWYGWKR